MTVTVEYNWLGGNGRETFPCENYRVSEGMIWLTQRTYSDKPTLGIPMTSIKKVIVDDK